MPSETARHSRRSAGTSGTELPLTAILYDLGSAGPAEILAAARGVCRTVFLCDPARPHVAEILPEIRKFAEVVEIDDDLVRTAHTLAELRPDGLTTFSEYAILETAELAQRCGLPFHTPTTAARLTDKYLQREALSAAGVQATRCLVVRGPADAAEAVATVGLPAVLKPRQGAGSRATYRVETPEELRTALAGIPEHAGPAEEFVVEELLVGDPAGAGGDWGDYVSVESLVQHGEVQHVCVTGKFPLAEPFREVGQFLPATLPAELARSCTDLAGQAVDALGVTVGVTHTELKLTADGPRIIEVNGRIGGYVNDVLTRSSGTGLLRAALRAAVGLDARVEPPAFSRLAYRRYLVAPADATRVLTLDGTDQVAAVPGVQYVEWRASAGSALDWRGGTQSCLGVVYGTAACHEDLLRTVAEIDRSLVATYAY